MRYALGLIGSYVPAGADRPATIDRSRVADKDKDAGGSRSTQELQRSDVRAIVDQRLDAKIAPLIEAVNKLVAEDDLDTKRDVAQAAAMKTVAANMDLLSAQIEVVSTGLENLENRVNLLERDEPAPSTGALKF
jgi:hypothetical protein